MILADKIINERKKNGWSQEELAEKLSVSRQSVSKWEGAQSVPDLQKIIAMAEIFGVTTDYLLKDEIDATTEVQIVEDTKSMPPVRKVTLEEANEYISIVKATAPKIANAVSLCILSPAILIILAGISESNNAIISEAAASITGVIILLAMIAVAVYIFIVYGSKTEKYEFLENEDIETAYGVSGMVNEKKKSMEQLHTNSTAIGVVLCILSPVPLIIGAVFEPAEYVMCALVAVLLLLVSVAVNIFIRVGGVWDCYNKLLEEGDFTEGGKRLNKKMKVVGKIYWGIALAIFLGWSFTTMRWDYTWMVWPVAGVLYGAVATIVKIVSKIE